MTDAEKLDVCLQALKEIRDKEGKVCENYELCICESCRSSHSSWVIADTALRLVEGNSDA